MYKNNLTESDDLLEFWCSFKRNGAKLVLKSLSSRTRIEV